MNQSTQAKGNDSLLQTNSSQRTTRANATTPFTTIAPSKARAEARKAQLLATKPKREPSSHRDSTTTTTSKRGRDLLFEEMNFEDRRIRRKLTRCSHSRRREDELATRAYIQALRGLELDVSVLGAFEHELDLPSFSKGNSTRAAVMAEALGREPSARYVRTGTVTAGGVHRWEKVEG